MAPAYPFGLSLSPIPCPGRTPVEMLIDSFSSFSVSSARGAFEVCIGGGGGGVVIATVVGAGVVVGGVVVGAVVVVAAVVVACVVGLGGGFVCKKN